MKRYFSPEMELLELQGTIATVNSNSLPIKDQNRYDPDDPMLNPDSREYDPEYARSLGLL